MKPTPEHYAAAVAAAEYDHKCDGWGCFTNAYKGRLEEYRQVLIKTDPDKTSRHTSLDYVDIHNHCLLLAYYANKN
jgi:hypothetical protein